jgi:hypothetical protein
MISYISKVVLRFICSKQGGYLCNSDGSIDFKWQWNDLRKIDQNKINKHLFADVIITN